MNYQLRTKNAFTLAELLITATILIILGLSALIGINPMLQIFKGYDTRRKDDLYKIRTAFEAYYTDHECYPPISTLSQCDSNALAPYLDKIPCDPTSHKSYLTTYQALNYVSGDSATCPQKFAIFAQLSNIKDPAGNRITYCTNKITQTSSNITFTETVKSCANRQICNTLYGCKDGTCQKLFVDETPTCGLTFCESDCRGRNCANRNLDCQ